MTGTCPLCGYSEGEIHATDKNPELYVCLQCFSRFYCDTVTEKGEEDMSWQDVDGKSGNGRDPDILELKSGTTKLMHVLLPDNDEPFSYWTHYIPNKKPGGAKGAVVICPGRDTCPACASGIYRTKRVHAINVWDYENKAVKILEGGNSIFQALKQIKEQIGTLTTVDISIKKIGEKLETTYSTIPIPMMTPFDPSQIHGVFPVSSLRMPNTPEEIQKVIDNFTPTTTAPMQNRPVPTADIVAKMATAPTGPGPDTQKQTSGPITLPFGKYTGKTIAEVYAIDANYIKWCAENISDPNVKAACKAIISIPQPTPPKDTGLTSSILSEATNKQLLINDINEIFENDGRYKGNFPLILEKLKTASASALHPNGKTILGEFELHELQGLYITIK
jgi:hypothetical protein